MTTSTDYTFEPELKLDTPRPARVKAAAAAMVNITAFIGFLVVIPLVWVASRDVSGLIYLRDHGKPVQAVVTSKRVKQGRTNTYYFGYELQSGRETVQDEDAVTRYQYDTTRVNDTVIATVFPDAPRIHRLGRVGIERVQEHETRWAVVIAVVAITFWGIAAHRRGINHQELRLARSGIAAQGVIVACEPRTHDPKPASYYVSCEFMTPTGRHRHEGYVPAALGEELGPDEGITVLYNPKNPAHAAFYRTLRYSEPIV